MIRYSLFCLLFLASCAKPLADFTIDAKDYKAPAKIKLTNNSTKAETYAWDFGDGVKSEETSPEHKYILSGKYKIILKAIKGKKISIMEKEIDVTPPQDCLLEMETTMGVMTIKLYDNTPLHRDNFIKLAESEFLDGLLFHRVIAGFMIQGGDPDSKNATPGSRLGSGGPDYTIPSEISAGNFHVKGALSAARQGDFVNPQKNSSGSQFYIVQGQVTPENQLRNAERSKRIQYSEEDIKKYTTIGGTPQLDNEYTVFGVVITGLDIIDKVAASQTDGSDRPVQDVKILKVRVIK